MFPYEHFWYCETKFFPWKSWYLHLSMNFIDTRNFLKHQKGPLTNFFLWHEEFPTSFLSYPLYVLASFFVPGKFHKHPEIFGGKEIVEKSSYPSSHVWNFWYLKLSEIPKGPNFFSVLYKKDLISFCEAPLLCSTQIVTSNSWASPSLSCLLSACSTLHRQKCEKL